MTAAIGGGLHRGDRWGLLNSLERNLTLRRRKCFGTLSCAAYHEAIVGSGTIDRSPCHWVTGSSH